jgi:predicted nucleic acid-binding protein
MKLKVYIETTVVSYLTSRQSADPVKAGHREATRRFWQKLDLFEPFVSDVVLQEANRGDPGRARARMAALQAIPLLEIDDDARALAKAIINEHAVPREFPEDAAHIAIAAVNGIDFIVTWNFSHINNPSTRIAIRQVIETAGYIAPEICSPDELLGDPA